MVIIVGAGLAGLACASRLQEQGVDWLLLESSRDCGGRVSTEATPEGFLLDRGFQVLLDSYPVARRLLNLEALAPRYFQSGALLAHNGEWERILNPLFHPRAVLATLLARSFSPMEKAALGLHAVLQTLRSDASLLNGESGTTSMEELCRIGLGKGMTERFLRPFFGGVFLDDTLATDASLLRYCLKKFFLGRALLPSGGMGEIPRQIEKRLPASRIRYGSRVEKLHCNGPSVKEVEIGGGERISCERIVLACDEEGTRRLLGIPPGRSWLEGTTLYFTGKEALYDGELLVLPSSAENRLVSHFTDITNTAPSYAPPGFRLLSATVLNPPPDRLPERVKEEITLLLPAFREWSFFREMRIRRALPDQRPGRRVDSVSGHGLRNLFLAGDQVAPAGIDSVLASGLRAADELLLA